MPTEPPTDMPADQTLDPKWEQEQSDRLLAYEILRRSINAMYQEVPSAELADLVAVDKGLPYRIIEKLREKHARR